mmetsp:Transcript_63331/g.151087  ORF Transcript_63331/g.151087 Transcript_63331/m.151087 type:complete len:299 (+) Transcript_63331:113-1009(+)
MGIGRSREEGRLLQPDAQNGYREAASPRRLDEPPEAKLPVVVITAETLSGKSATVEISPSEPVRTLKDRLGPLLNLSPRQLKLVNGDVVLGNGRLLEYGIEADTTVNVIVLPPLPDFADAMGLDVEHIACYRAFCERHKVADAELLSQSDDTHWEAFGRMVTQLAESERNRAGWAARLQLERKGQITTLHARPRERIVINVTGRVWNNNADSCIHQVLVMLDNEIVGEVYNGVPGRGRDFRASFDLKAPMKPGAYMFWKDTQLQYNMRDARQNTQRRINDAPIPYNYPDRFVGWLIVE